MPRPRPEIFSVESYVGGVSALPGIEKPIKLSSNEGAFGPPPGAIRALAESAARGHRYPDGGSVKLRAALGEKFGLDPARIVCAAGSDPLLMLLVQSYGGPGTELVMTEHGFSVYEIAGKIAGSIVRKVAERDFTADVEAILGAITPRTTLVMLANPNNPTGTMLPLDELRRLRAALPENVLLVLDGAYAEYVERADYDPGVALVDAGENTVMTRTFSKIFGLGGVRLGWAYAPGPIADVLNRVREPFSTSLPAQEAGIAALAEPGWIETSRAHNARAREKLTARLASNAIRVIPSVANFILADFGSAEAARAADAHLRARGIIVRNVASYGLPSCLRITIGLDAECDAVADALGEFAHG